MESGAWKATRVMSDGISPSCPSKRREVRCIHSDEGIELLSHLQRSESMRLFSQGVSIQENRCTSRLLIVVAMSCAAVSCDGACGGRGTVSSQAIASSTAAHPAASSGWRSTLRARGAAGKIFRAARSLTLTDEQRTALDKIGTVLREAERVARESERDAGFANGELKAVHAELIAGVKAGKIDVAKLDAHEAALERSEQARHRREADAITGLQRVLEPHQRSVVGATVRAEEAKLGRRATGPITARDAGADPRRINWARLRLESYMSDLALDPDQEKKMQAALPTEEAIDPRQGEARNLEALLSAFERDGFHADPFPLGDANNGRGPLFRLARFLAQVTPILKPEQNEKLAGKLVEPEPRRRGARGGAEVLPEEDDDTL